MAPVRAPTLEKQSFWCPFTRLLDKYVVPLLCEELSRSSLTSVTSNFSNTHTKYFLSSKKFLCGCRFFLSTFVFIAHFLWACVTPRESQNFYLKHSFSTYTCLSNNSLISAWISTKFVSTLLLCMLYQANNFQYKKYLNVFERYFYTAC